ncbi:MAG: hypothetical protein GXX78_00115 [Bacteroidales bacterium]|nr:hypothetical protein [Bacteroidales bacterium]
MKKVVVFVKMVLVLLFLLLLVYSCKKDTETTGGGDVVDVASIGKEGGELSDDVITVEFQKNCFTETKTIKLTNVETVEEFGAYQATDFYSITNLPANYKEPIIVTLNPDETLKGKQLLMVVGEMKYSTTLHDNVFAYEFLDAVDEDGTYTISYQPLESVTDDKQTLSLTFGLVKDYVTTSEQQKSTRNFVVYAPATEIEAALDVEDYLNESYEKLNAMGFSYAARTKWPIKVTLSKFPAEHKNAYGFFTQSSWSHNRSTLEFNLDMIENSQDVKATAGHEFFHFVQSLYNNTGALSKKLLGDPFYWLDEASSVWFEGIILGNPDYNSSIRDGHHMEPLNGAYEQAEKNPAHYGYGMAAMIKYIVKRYGNNSVLKIYQKVLSGEAKDPVDAITRALPESFGELYPDFLNEYFQRKIYSDFNISALLQGFDQQFEIRSLEDSVHVFKVSNLGLAAKILRIETSLSSGEFSQAQSLLINSFSLNPKIIYKLKGATLTYLGTSSGEFLVEGLKEIEEQNAVLLVVMVNTNHTNKEESVEVKLSKVQYDAVYAYLNVRGNSGYAAVKTQNEVEVLNGGNLQFTSGSYDAKANTFIADNGATSVSLYLDRIGKTMSGTIHFQNIDPGDPDHMVYADVNFSGLPFEESGGNLRSSYQWVGSVGTFVTNNLYFTSISSGSTFRFETIRETTFVIVLAKKKD